MAPIKLYGNKKTYVLLVLVIIIFMMGTFYYLAHRKITLRLGLHSGSSWGVPNSRDNRVIDLAIEAFEAKHPQVDVVYESGIPKEDYANWLSDQIILGEQADIFMVPENDFTLLASTGALANLTPYLNHQFASENYYEAALASGQYQGLQYALPFESNPIMMCVNKDLLAAEGLTLPDAPWTLAELYQISKAVTKDKNGDGVVDQYGITDYDWLQALTAHGGQLFDQDGRIDVSSTEMREALTYVAKLDALNGGYQVTSEDFDQGRVAFYPMSLAQYRTYKPYPYHVAKYSTFAWTCVQMPALNSDINATQVETSLFAMSAKTSHPDLVWEFLSLLSADKTIQQDLFNHSQGMSVLKSVMTSHETATTLKADDFGEDSLSAETLNQLMAHAVVQRKFKHYHHILARADHLISKAMIEKNLDSELPIIQKELDEEVE